MVVERTHGARAVAVASLLAACGAASALGCVAAQPEPVAPVGVSTPSESPATFSFDSLDARPVSSAALRGKVAVISFFTTGNIASQAQVNVLMAMAKHDAERKSDAVRYALVAMEPKTNRELIELYRSKLGVTFPVAIADDETLAGRGPFGTFDAVPTTVILDQRGRVAWRHVGIAKPEELRDVMSGL